MVNPLTIEISYRIYCIKLCIQGVSQLGNEKSKKRKSRHTVEEKQYAVKQVMYQNRHRVDVAIEMQISMGTMNNWLRRYQLEGTEGLHPKRESKVKENGKEELERLRVIEKKYYEVQEDNEILKKFQASLEANEKRNASKR